MTGPNGSRLHIKRSVVEAFGVRHLILVDVENIAGTACMGAVDLGRLHADLQAALAGEPAGQWVVASSHRAAAHAAFAFAGARHRWQSGKDGADLLLLEELWAALSTLRYDQVTLCSGDGIFTEVIYELSSAGVETLVVSRVGSLSGWLHNAADRVVLLENDTYCQPTGIGEEVSLAS